MDETFNKEHFNMLVYNGETEKAVEYCWKFVKVKDNEALITLSDCYFSGLGVAKHVHKAFTYAKDAAESKEGVLQLAKMILKGVGTHRDPKGAVCVFKRFAIEKDPIACCYLARCYRDGTGVKKNARIAEMLFKISIDAGNTAAMCSLCELYIDGKVQCDDKAEVKKIAKRALHAFNLNALYIFGKIAEKGFGCNINQELADEFYISGAERGNIKCILMLCKRIYEKKMTKYLDNEEKRMNIILTGAQYFDRFALSEFARCVCDGADLEKLCTYIEKTRTFTALVNERKIAGIDISSNSVLLNMLFNACESDFVQTELKGDLKLITCKHALTVQSIKGLSKGKMPLDNYFSDTERELSPDERLKVYEMYKTGRLVDENPKCAMHFLYSAYNAGSPEAAYVLGELHEFGSTDLSIAKNKERALGYYKEASQKGERRAMRKMALQYKSGSRSVDSDPLMARELFGRASVSDPRAMFELGLCYETGFGGCKDIKRAKLLYEKAAEHGSTPAKARLGEILITGALGAQKNETRAFELLSSTIADKRDNSGYALMGTMYYEGIATRKDTKKGLNLLNSALIGKNSMLAKRGVYIDNEIKEFEDRKKRAMNGDSDAAMELYGSYLLGLGCEKDPYLAEKWLYRAAELKNKFAMYKVGRWFSAEEISGESIYDMFAYCDENAKNSRKADYNLAMCYFMGRGVKRNLNIALERFMALMYGSINDEVARILPYALSECKDALSIAPDAEMVTMLKRVGIQDSFALYKLGKYLEEGKIDCGDKSPQAAAIQYYSSAAKENDARAYMALYRASSAIGLSDIQPLINAAGLSYGEALCELFNSKEHSCRDLRSMRKSYLKGNDEVLLKRAVLQGEGSVMYEFGTLYTQKDFYNPYIAFHWLDRACKFGDERACLLASELCMGQKCPEIIENRERAKFYLTEYGKESHSAMTRYARLLYEEGKYRDAAKVAAEAVNAASNNNPKGYMLLAELCEKGLTDVCVQENAIDFYMKAAELFKKSGNDKLAEKAEFLLGKFLYENGGVYEGKILAKKSEEALAIIRQAAERGIPDAMAMCAMASDTPDLDLLSSAAEKGSEKAALILIDMYSSEGSCDPGKLLKYCEYAEKAGNKDAFYRLGKLYEEGVLLEKDEIYARSYYSRATMMGNELARARLAEFYREGKGCMKDALYAKLLEES